MTVTSRAYADSDLPNLQAALAEWRRTAGLCGYCHVGDLAHRIYADQAVSHPRKVLARVWEDDSVPVGIAVLSRFGVVFDVFTSPALRGSEPEVDMLRWAYRTTSRYMAAPAPVVSDVYDHDDVRARLLLELGFPRHQLWEFVTEAELRTVPPRPDPPPRFHIRRATREDCGQLVAIRNASFGTRWTPEHYRVRVMNRPGYDPGREFVAVASGGQIGAFACTWVDPVNHVGHFEPVGTHPDYRCRGLARAVMLHGLRDLREQGMTWVTVQHDASNGAAARLYSGLGFEKRHETFGFNRAR